MGMSIDYGLKIFAQNFCLKLLHFVFCSSCASMGQLYSCDRQAEDAAQWSEAVAENAPELMPEKLPPEFSPKLAPKLWAVPVRRKRRRVELPKIKRV